MGQWVDRIRNHRVWALLQAVGPALDSALKRENLGPDLADSIERLRTVLAYCENRLAALDASLVVPGHLESMANTLIHLKSNVDTFVANGDVAQLHSANDQADTALTFLARVSAPMTESDLTSISESAAHYYATLKNSLEEAQALQRSLAERVNTFEQSLSEKTKVLEQKAATLESSLTSEQQRLAGLITDYQSQFSTAQDKRATDFAAAQNEQLSKFTTASTEFQTQFSTDQDARKNAFSEFQRTSTEKVATFVSNATEELARRNKDYATKLEEFSKDYSDNLVELQKGYAKKAEDILQEMEGNKKRVEDLVGIIGTHGVTSGYQKVANQARLMLYLWQTVTSFSLVGLISVAILTAFPPLGEKWFGVSLNGTPKVALEVLASNRSSESKDKAAEGIKVDAKLNTQSSPQVESSPEIVFYHGLATRIFLAITFGIFAGYAGRQASHFMSVERKNRKLALELEALGPFVEPLSPEDQNRFRIQVGERSFGVPDEERHEKHKGDDPVTIFDLLRSKELRDAFLDFYNKSKKSES